MKNDVRFINLSIAPLLRAEQPPRLQALVKAVTARIKAIQNGDPKVDPEARSSESLQIILDSLVKQAEYLAEVINHTNADVRKCCVFCLVEIFTVMSYPPFNAEEVFQIEFLARLNPS